MRPYTYLILAFAMLLSVLNPVTAQDKLKLKYGKITAADFDLSKQKFDTGASAVVIADIGSSRFQGSNDGWFELHFNKHARIKILNKNGLDAANVSIFLYSNGRSEEKIQNLKATTYNLEDGKVVATDLDKKSIFKDKYDKNRMQMKFTLPAVKEGSIIEYSFTQVSDFLHNLQPWEFQGEYPVLYSEYQVQMPDFFNYVFLSQGSFMLKHDVSNSRENYNITESSSTRSSDRYSITAHTALHTWIATNVPALRGEGFTSTIDNHISKIEFQLSQYRFPNMPVKDIMGNWQTLSTELMKDEDFGAELIKTNNWLDEDLKTVVADSKNALEKTQKIYAYVRDRFMCTGNRGIGMTTSLRNTNKNKNGYVADINLLLTAMLKRQGIEANPVILSTRSHGYTHEFYPLINRFNYVVCEAVIDDKVYYLDASNSSLGFNKLSTECYNGHARVVTPTTAKPIYFSADSLTEKKLTRVLVRSEKPGEWKGHFASNKGYYESISVRSKVKENGEELFFKSIQSSYSGDWSMSEQKIDRLKELESPVKIEYDFAMNQDEDMIYFSPMFGEEYKENPFKSAERTYPVEIPYRIDETYLLNLEIPADYAVDEIPKSAKVNLGDGDGFFEYIIDNTGTTVRLRSRLKLNRANFAPEEYNDLRGFFSLVVKKHAEPIVFKKKK